MLQKKTENAKSRPDDFHTVFRNKCNIYFGLLQISDIGDSL